MNTLHGTHLAEIEQQGAIGRVAADAPSAAGASPCNTAPANSTVKCARIIRIGIDSIYLSFQGKLLPEWDARLKACKLSAKSDVEAERLQAQVNIGGHRFEVLDRGRGRAAYVLVDNWFSISLAGATNTSVPVAYIKVSNESLVLEGLARVLAATRDCVSSIAITTSGPHISRIDLCVDFLSEIDLRQFDCEHWVTRARDFAKRYVDRQFSGWSIGLGGIVSGRLYNKSLELQKSKKSYMQEVWKAYGYEGNQNVWRLEFQIERQALVELGFDTTNDLEGRLESIWLYCTQNWLRLAIPNPADDTSARWPTHPVWLQLSAAWSPGQSTPAAMRARKERVPSDERLFVHGLGGITSFMATRGIIDLGEGYGEFLASAKEFHDCSQMSLEKYVRAKVLKKGLRFNTINTHIDTAEERELLRQRAERYRRAKDGE
ncbi:MAG: hypothetical protein M3O26_00055 [Pseudomonadota bacterium]|nr:hypothetical protein [Pseudomonadota bacterium]